ncbi:MAG: flagellar export chaperone FliS [Gammaproteobacteria bacterium]|nr:flagellar export chaperone FliS [Gammaproteobacteria bacterium]
MNALTALAQYGQMKSQAAQYASPHQLVLLLFNGAIESLSVALGAIDSKDIELRGKHISRSVTIINGLRDVLDLEQGGEVADNLYSLYTYMASEIFKAGFRNDQETLTNIQQMLKDIRESWEKIPIDMYAVSAHQA